MKAIFPFLILCIFLSCIGLPKIKSADEARKPEILKNCSLPFTSKKYRFIHSINAAMPGGERTVIIGISVVDPELRSIESAIMTVEGLVLFEAVYNNGLSVKRGVPPFDSKDFAKALMDDIRLIFFAPESKIESYGIYNNEYVCRYELNEKRIEDIAVSKDGSWTIYQYDTSYSLVRSVKANSINKEGIPQRIDLKSHEFFGYSLKLELISAEVVPAGNPKH